MARESRRRTGPMLRKRHKPEEIVAKLRQVDVLMAQGTPVADAVRSIGVTEVASGRAAGWGDLLLSAGSADHHRELETSLQHGAAARVAGLPSTGSGGVRARLRRLAGCATPTGSARHATRGATAHAELTSPPDHPRGADQPSSASATTPFGASSSAGNSQPRRTWTLLETSPTPVPPR